MEETERGIIGVWEYNTDLFNSSTIERMTGHLVTLLTAIVDNPEQKIAELPLLTAEETEQLLNKWNQTQTNYPKNKCVHQIFEEQVESNPEAIAVVWSEQKLTYRELNNRANQLAEYLKTLGVETEEIIGICVERSLEMVIGILGIIKAGAAYLPLDPENPSERLNLMLQDAKVKTVLTKQQWLEKLHDSPTRKVSLDRDWEEIAQKNPENQKTKITANNLAYIIYTSGTTGQPKGVLISHRGLLNLVFWHQSEFQINPSDKATQIAGIAFDAAGWEIWPYLSTGASIYLVKPEIVNSPTELRDWLQSQEITISFIPTPLAEKLLSLEWGEVKLRKMLIGGDQLHNYPPETIPFELINNYGPSENTVVATSGKVIKNPETENSPPAIGRPIANTEIYILDAHQQPVPIGVAGELHIGGVGLAKGYLNRPELTTEKFILNPFSKDVRTDLVENLCDPEKTCEQNPPLLYKTGDLARYLPDGNIEYLGRIDNQVKIRGFRIE
ncbi:MAG: amino acid adenylation domain-containing protein, partial [Phormidium sp.]